MTRAKTRARGADYLAIVEAAYSSDQDERAWLQGVADAALPCLDQGLGLIAFTIEIDLAGNLLVPSFARAGNRPVQAASDALWIHGIASARCAACVGVPYRHAVGPLSPLQTRVLSCISSHLASGLRLRRADSKRRLRKQSQATALDLWQAMVQGEWVLVSRRDDDGRRFVLARRNRSGVADIAALSARERQVAVCIATGYLLKQVAYDLGLSLSTVSTHLGSAMRKLRIRSRAELVELLGRDSRP